MPNTYLWGSISPLSHPSVLPSIHPSLFCPFVYDLLRPDFCLGCFSQLDSSSETLIISTHWRWSAAELWPATEPEPLSSRLQGGGEQQLVGQSGRLGQLQRRDVLGQRGQSVLHVLRAGPGGCRQTEEVGSDQVLPGLRSSCSTASLTSPSHLQKTQLWWTGGVHAALAATAPHQRRQPGRPPFSLTFDLIATDIKGKRFHTTFPMSLSPLIFRSRFDIKLFFHIFLILDAKMTTKKLQEAACLTLCLQPCAKTLAT